MPSIRKYHYPFSLCSLRQQSRDPTPPSLEKRSFTSTTKQIPYVSSPELQRNSGGFSSFPQVIIENRRDVLTSHQDSALIIKCKAQPSDLLPSHEWSERPGSLDKYPKSFEPNHQSWSTVCKAETRTIIPIRAPSSIYKLSKLTQSFTSRDGSGGGGSGWREIHMLQHTSHITNMQVRGGAGRQSGPSFRMKRNFYIPSDAGRSWLFGSGVVVVGSVITTQ